MRRCPLWKVAAALAASLLEVRDGLGESGRPNGKSDILCSLNVDEFGVLPPLASILLSLLIALIFPPIAANLISILDPHPHPHYTYTYPLGVSRSLSSIYLDSIDTDT